MKLLKLLKKTTSKKLNLRYENDEKSFIHDITADISKIKKITKWNPKLSFQEGLEKEL